MLLPWLALLPDARRFVLSLLGGVATGAVFWALWRSVDVWAQFLMERNWARDNPSARSLLSVTSNLAMVFVGIGGVVATLAAFGYLVATVLAGLGIGGIAIAFGAQKTIENLFGSIALAANQPFRVGDLVRVEDITGNVESDKALAASEAALQRANEQLRVTNIELRSRNETLEERVTARRMVMEELTLLAPALLLALIVDREIRDKHLYRVVFYLPPVLSGIVVGLVWNWISPFLSETRA